MASLNMRYQLRMTQAHTLNTSGSKRSARFAQNMDQKIERPIEMQGQHVQIDVEKRIKYDELPIPTWKSKISRLYDTVGFLFSISSRSDDQILFSTINTAIRYSGRNTIIQLGQISRISKLSNLLFGFLSCIFGVRWAEPERLLNRLAISFQQSTYRQLSITNIRGSAAPNSVPFVRQGNLFGSEHLSMPVPLNRIIEMTDTSIPKTYGALLLGAFFASFLSGAMTLQTIVYLKLYPKDELSTRGLVAVVWALDVVHTAMIWDGLWTYMIRDFGDVTKIQTIPLSISLTIIFTAVLTLLVHFYYVQRIHLLSKRKFWISAPILVLAICRVCSACVTSAEMIHFGMYESFRVKFKWLFSLGLAISSTVDVIITLCLFTLLWMSRSKSMSLDNVIDSLILYTFEIGSLTGFATIVSMVCWLVVKNNLIFLGLHFVIGKLYANSFMASLNARHQLRRAHANSVSSHVNNSRRHERLQPKDEQSTQVELGHVHVNVEKSVQYDEESPAAWRILSTGDRVI
ncbi:hypothetical protein APHAL10511_007898 [Amanita phalloides]|nr:hypothetical protein APHAL10511_007898 [Amanita phalloides]